jgi:tRNA-splicing ligase RtcB (3'-phosphate/5'-hydroxy nucleic acid ligase)
MKIIEENGHYIPVWGNPLPDAVKQMGTCLSVGNGSARGALMADHHLGYAAPVGTVIAREGEISPSECGFDIGCGNKAVLTNMKMSDLADRDINKIMDDVVKHVSFGIGRQNKEEVDHDLFDDSAWDDIPMLGAIKDMARGQLGTVGSGNHYVDIFHDEKNCIWIGVHFGSRGLGHKIASHYIKEGGGTDGIFVDPVVLSLDTELGQEYVAAMQLAGRYAYAGRDWVCDRVAKILGANIMHEVHNHHNYAWEETHQGKDLWVVRKGATPAFPGQEGFVGGTMGEQSVILEGVDDPESALGYYSTVHGAGRVLSRTQAAGKFSYKKGQRVRKSEGCISQDMMDEWVNQAGICLRGAGVDESPHCYKRLRDVINAHANTINVKEILTPIGVAMAGADIYDPYKD